MSTQKDAVDHPYDWVDPQAEYWATHKRPAPDYAILDASKIDLTQLEILPGDMVYWRQGNDYNRATWDDLSQNADRISNPWANGRYALSAIVWGLILMFTFSVGVGS